MQLSFRNPHQLSRLARSSAALPLSGTESPLRGLLLVVLLLSSSATTLKGQVAAAPTINLQPVSADLFKGQATTLTAAFSGNPGLAFQWYSGFAGDTSRPISGATSASYRAVARDKVERYWLRATNAAGIADSQAAIVTPWSERTKPPIVGRIFKVGSQLVSIARNYVQTSPDGRVWSPRDFVATDTFLGESNGYNFAIGAGRYVVAGERGVYESSNLTSWSRVVLPGLALFAYPSARAITFEGGRFWISAFQNIYSSSTGFTWIKNETGFTNFITRSIAHSGSRIVAIGTFLTGASNLEVPGIISSVDGISWIRCDLGIDIFNPPTIDRGTLNSVIFANGKFVVAASADNFYSSADGVSWIRSRVAGGGASNSIAFGNGMFVAGNEGSPYFATSTDGVNWTNRIAKLGLGFGSLSFVDGRFLAASPFDFLHASVDGINWTEISGAPSVVNSVTAGGGRYSIGAAYSDDGEVWHTAVTESMVPGSVGYLNGLFVSSSINNVGKIYTSTDANTWVQRNVVGATQGYSRFAYGNGTYVMLGTDSAATSTDGINWTARPIPVALLTTPFRGLAFGQGQFVAVGDGGHIATSTDGQNWTLREGRTTPPFDNFTSVAFGLGRFVAFGSYNSTAIKTSTDGITWSTQSFQFPTDAIYDVVFGGGRFLAIGLNWIFASDDGLNWRKTEISLSFTSGPQPGSGLCFGHNGWYGPRMQSVADVLASPLIYSELSARGQSGLPFAYQISASNAPTSFNATGLPPGLNVNTASGAITGVPTLPGTYSVSISASNSTGTDTKTLSILVLPAPPVISSILTAASIVGFDFSYSIAASNAPDSFNATGLPPGLIVNRSTGLISGRPTASGLYGVTIAAANTGGTDTRTLAISVAIPEPPAISSPLTGSIFVGAPYNYTITASNAPASFNATGLPAGLTVNQATGAITGVPTVAGTYGVTIAAANTGGADRKTLVLTVTVPPAPVLNGRFATTGKLHFPYSYTITASNFPTSYNANGLPPGLGVNTATGAITGAPTGLGTYLVTIAAANGSGIASTTLAISVTLAPQDSFLSGTQSDLLLENSVTGERVIWQMNGASIAGSANLPSFTAGWHFAGTGDFNSDGRSDIVLQNTVSGERVVWLMNGATISSSAAFPTLPLAWQIACVGDLNSDGKPDVILQNTTTNERVAWLMNGTAIASSYNLPTLPAAWLFCGIMDFNGDSLPDLLIQNTDTGERVIWILNAQLGITQSFNLPTFYDGWRFAGVGRFTPDNLPNIILQNTLNGERLLWSIGTTGAITASTALPTLPVTWSLAGPALNRAKPPVASDLNRDGKPDILVTDTTSGDRILWVMNGPAIAGSVALPNLPNYWRFVGTGDFNADGMNDVLLQNSTTGERQIWLMDETVVAGSTALPSLPTAWSLAAVGDINQDGQPDIVLENRTSGERVIWFMDKTAISASANLPTIPVDWTIAAVGNFTAGGNPTLLLENTRLGERTFWILNTAGSYRQSVPLPTLPDGWRFAGAAPYFGGTKPHILLENLERYGASRGERRIWRMDNTTIASSTAVASLPVNYILKN